MDHTALLNITISLGIGVIILGLVKYTFSREKGLLMTREEHHTACDTAKKIVSDNIREQFDNFREHFDTQLDLKVTQSLHDLNGKLEAKIEGIVANQVKGLKNDIDTKLNLIDIMRAIVKERV